MAMVSVGSCLFSLIGAVTVGERTDPTRIAAQVVTGIGFLGAGTILRDRGGIRGLTTAATIWVVAGIGMATGFGFYVLAVGGTALVLAALILMRLARSRLQGAPAGGEGDDEPPQGGS
jgi:putative Mg2+ transporter-C (MgtC) family protein